MRILDKRHLIFIGHYGSGKTTLSVNTAYQLRNDEKSIFLADIDVNNPYFRSRDWIGKLEKNNIHVVIPDIEIAYAEMPFVPKDIYSALRQKNNRVILDVGGSDVGTKVLGSLAQHIEKEDDFSLLFVVNTFRPGSETPEEIITMFHHLESLAKLKITGLIHNSNLAQYTTAEHVLEGQKVVGEAARQLQIPLLATVVETKLENEIESFIDTPIIPMDRVENLNW